MATNKFAGTCKECGEMVMPGKGDLTKEFDNYEDEVVWIVRHTKKSICESVKASSARECSKNNAIGAGLHCIQTHGTRSTKIVDGDTVVYDGRVGYNSVGWLLTRTENTLYLTSRSNLDGHDMSETYIYTGTQSKIEDLLWTMELI